MFLSFSLSFSLITSLIVYCRLDYILLPCWRYIEAAILKKPPGGISSESSLSLGKWTVLYISLLLRDSFAKQPVAITSLLSALFFNSLLRTKAEAKCNCSLHNLCTRRWKKWRGVFLIPLLYKQSFMVKL